MEQGHLWNRVHHCHFLTVVLMFVTTEEAKLQLFCSSSQHGEAVNGEAARQHLKAPEACWERWSPYVHQEPCHVDDFLPVNSGTPLCSPVPALQPLLLGFYRGLLQSNPIGLLPGVERAFC